MWIIRTKILDKDHFYGYFEKPVKKEGGYTTSTDISTDGHILLYDIYFGNKLDISDIAYDTPTEFILLNNEKSNN